MTKTLRSSSEPVLQARMVGEAPDLRHPLAPPEIIYLCEEPRRPRTTWLQRCIGIYGVVTTGAAFVYVLIDTLTR